jgi:hypothetical protein
MANWKPRLVRDRGCRTSHLGLTVLTQDQREYGAELLLDSEPSRKGPFHRAKSNEMMVLFAGLSGRLEPVWRHHQISMGVTTPPCAWSQT